MKRVMKFIKQNMIGFIFGLSIMGMVVVTAATIVPASGVTYSNSASNVTNVNEALDELFERTVGTGDLELKTMEVATSSNNTWTRNELVVTTTGSCVAFMLIQDYISGTYGGATYNYVKVYGDNTLLFESNVTDRKSRISIDTHNYTTVKVEVSSRHSTSALTNVDFVVALQ